MPGIPGPPDWIVWILAQIPITGFVVWVILQLLKQSAGERKIFMDAMEKTDTLFAAELKAERESRERLANKQNEGLISLSSAISELRSEVRLSGNVNHRSLR